MMFKASTLAVLLLGLAGSATATGLRGDSDRDLQGVQAQQQKRKSLSPLQGCRRSCPRSQGCFEEQCPKSKAADKRDVVIKNFFQAGQLGYVVAGVQGDPSGKVAQNIRERADCLTIPDLPCGTKIKVLVYRENFCPTDRNEETVTCSNVFDVPYYNIRLCRYSYKVQCSRPKICPTGGTTDPPTTCTCPTGLDPLCVTCTSGTSTSKACTYTPISKPCEAKTTYCQEYKCTSSSTTPLVESAVTPNYENLRCVGTPIPAKAGKVCDPCTVSLGDSTCTCTAKTCQAGTCTPGCPTTKLDTTATGDDLSGDGL